MNALAATTRSWPMLGALGAGLVLAALAAGAGGAPQVVLAGLGVAALGWGGLSLHAGRILAPRAVLATAATALVSLGLLVMVDGRASLLGLVGGAALVAALATPALAATDAGRQAQPHGEHAVVAPLDRANDPGHSH